MDNPLMKPMPNPYKMKTWEKLGASWYFEKPYEKLILMIMSALAVWKLIDIIFFILGGGS